MARSEFRPPMAAGARLRAAAIRLAGGAAILAASALPAAAEEAQAAEGAQLYRQHCAACHGVGGKGDGPVAERLKTRPPALTTLARRHGGDFPTDYVLQIIDGREQRRVHGGRNMPVWGTYFGLRAQGQGQAREAPDTETAIRQRISALIEHLEAIQVTYTAAGGEAAATERLLEHHLQARAARDIAAVMEGYGEDSVLVLPTGILQGREQIGDYYDALFAEFAQPGASFTLVERTVVGNVAHIVWSGETPGQVYDHTSETIATSDGRIGYQIVAFRTMAK